MQLNHLKLLNFRNYERAEIAFSNGVNVIYGENGAGKTSILEAIHYLALTKSFRAKADKHLILKNTSMCRVQGAFVNGQGQSLRSTIAYSLDDGKHLTKNGHKVQKFSEYIGDVPIVLLFPADLALSQGSPQLRRRFLDVLLSQSSKLYLNSLIQYNRSLRQRNLLLQSDTVDKQLLLSWEENLIKHGTEIICKRRDAAAELSEAVCQNYQALSSKGAEITIRYQCNVKAENPEMLAAAYRQMFDKKRVQEREYGATMVGPHRDDLLFLLDGQPMKIFASQGEHKTFVISLKLAEYHHLEQQQHQTPILLFDDIFGELDAHRIRQMLEQLSAIGQVFVTTTSRSFFDKVQQFDTPTSYFAVENGAVIRAEA